MRLPRDSRPTAEIEAIGHRRLRADLDDVKLRLGVVREAVGGDHYAPSYCRHYAVGEYRAGN
jgi:hypothetical protein